MKYDVSREFEIYDGKKVAVDENTNVTYKDMLERVCTGAPAEEAKNSDDKLKVYRILQKVHAASPTVSLKADEVSLLQKISGKTMNVVAHGAIVDFLESPVIDRGVHVEEDAEE